MKWEGLDWKSCPDEMDQNGAIVQQMIQQSVKVTPFFRASLGYLFGDLVARQKSGPLEGSSGYGCTH